MTTETVLTAQEILHEYHGTDTDFDFARAIEQAVLQSPEIQALRNALKFYADGEHFVRHDDSAWDTVSGEPQNLYEDEAGTATVEDGTFARIALNAAMEQQT